MIKRHITFLTILVLLMLSVNAMAAEKIELRVSWWGAETRHRATLEAIELYEELNPHITIIPEYAGFEGYQNKLLSQVLAGNAPDVFTSIMEWYPDLVDADGMADLTGMIDVSGHNPQYVEASSYDGKMYGVNLSVNAMVLIENTTLLEELGVEPLESPYTWEDLRAKWEEVYEKSNGQVYGAADFTATPEGMGFSILGYYGYSKLGHTHPFPFDDDQFTITKEDIQDFLQYFDDMRKSNALAPVGISAMNDFSANSLLIQRMTAYEINYAGTYERYQDQTPDNLVPKAMPVGPNGEGGDLARPGLIFNVAKNSKHVEEAAKFIDWFTNSPEAARILKMSRGVLPTESQRAALQDADLSAIDHKVNEIMDEIMQRDFILAYVGPSGNHEISSVVLPEISQMVGFGQATVEEAAEEFMRSIQ